MRAPYVLALCAACGVEAPAAEAPVIHARFDLGAKVMPTPNDILREDGHLALPSAPADLEGKTPGEVALIAALNARDGWPTRMEAKLDFDGELDPASVTPASVRVFELGDEGPRAVEGVTLRFERTRVVIAPPEEGWSRGRAHVVAAIGGARGLRGARGEPVVADSSFWFLRARVDLSTHPDAFPGATREERLATARRLEGIRRSLAAPLAELERGGIARAELVASWQFTTTAAPEVVMDKAAGEMPIPSGFLLDPITGRVDLPVRPEDSALVAQTKRDLGRYDGFSISADLWFDLTAPIDPRTVTATSVRLFAVEGGGLRPVPVSFALKRGDRRVMLSLTGGPLVPATDHVVVLTRAVKDTRGLSVAPMLPGMLAMSSAPIHDGHASTVASVDGESAARVEPVRAKLAEARAALERVLPWSEVAVAWPFRTLSVVEPMRAARDLARTLEFSRDPVVLEERGRLEALADFPLSSLTLLRVGRVIEGTITTPDFLDPSTRRRREDGGWEPRAIHFTMAIPASADRGAPLKVAIFGHGLMTERRFALSIADALAGEGYATIAIDLPYHGQRTHCVWKGPQCFVNPLDLTAAPICGDPCERGDSCAPDGRCVDSAGREQPLRTWPLVNFPLASGGAFLDVDDMVGTKDHFYQGVTDLSALVDSLRRGDWRRAIGHPIDPGLVYAGQSLGGIFGALFAATHPEIPRVVLNVPGADLIDLFRESTMFKSHFEALLARENVVAGSPEHDRLLNVARWVMDPVDPQSFTDYLLRRSLDGGGALGPRTMLIQMATLDTVIPNTYTRKLAELSGVMRKDYVAEHGFIVVPVEPGYWFGIGDLVDVLANGRLP